MFRAIIELVRLLTPQQRKELLLLQMLVILMAFAELAGIASIGPFMALVGNIDLLEKDGMLGQLYRLTGMTNPFEFVFWAGIAALFVLACSAVISIFTLWRLSFFGQKVGMELGDRLYENYMYQPWLFHASGNTALFNKKISSGTHSVTSYIIHPLLMMNAKIVLAIFIAVPMLFFNPLVAMVGLPILALAYLGLYQLVRQSLDRNGQMISDANGNRYELVSEGFGGIRDVLLLGRQRYFIRRFNACGEQISRAQGANQAIMQAPRYFMEVLAFGGVIMLVLYLIKSYQGNLGAVLPMLAVYALAGFKLLPALQGIYSGVASIRAGLPAFEDIKEDLGRSLYNVPPRAEGQDSLPGAFGHTLEQGITLRGVEFTYPGKVAPAISHLDILIPARKVIGIVGATGSGKSTLVDLILGLIPPDQGEILIDGKPLVPGEMRDWQTRVGFVPQSIYLSNTSILENIAFGLPADAIDMARARQAASKAHLDELVARLPDGLSTRVGERGVQLSGGQRQRIGIARSLYHDAEVLILDEATSALDGITEKLVMDAIHDFSGRKTIIMIAHRFATIQKCDVIFMMENGCLKDQGTYQELFERNENFRRMALHV